VELLNDEDIERLHEQYRKDDLYRYCGKILSCRERNYGLPNQTVIWFQSEKLIDMLIKAGETAQDEIPRLINNLWKDCHWLECGHQSVTIPPLKAMAVVQEVFFVLFLRLCNAVEEGHERERIPNDNIAKVIYQQLETSEFFQSLMSDFRKNEYDCWGTPIHITPSDPMKKALPGTLLPSEQDKARKLYGEVMKITQPLDSLFSDDNRKQWQALWHRITDDERLRNKLSVCTPRSKVFGNINGKMICNVLGMFRNSRCPNVAVKKMADAFHHGNVTSYIRNFADNGSDSVVDKNERRKIETFIKC
jgi:hypothetical protein